MKRLLILLMLVSQPAWAEWVIVGSAPGGSDAFTHYIDPATLRKTPNGRRVWTLNDYEQPQTDRSGSYRSTLLVNEFDCAGERSRFLQGSAFSGQMGAGSVVGFDNSPGQWSIVAPGSIGDITLKAVCRMPLK